MGPFRRWNALRVFGWGAAIGAVVGTASFTGEWSLVRLPDQIGGVVGYSFGLGMILGLAAVARNAMIRSAS